VLGSLEGISLVEDGGTDDDKALGADDGKSDGLEDVLEEGKSEGN